MGTPGDEIASINNFVTTKTKIPWPVVYGAGLTSQAFGVSFIPAVVIIEPDGTVLTNSDETGEDVNSYLKDLITSY